MSARLFRRAPYLNQRACSGSSEARGQDIAGAVPGPACYGRGELATLRLGGAGVCLRWPRWSLLMQGFLWVGAP
jgi:hypothetical protein